jgi:hypothetical protein
MPRREREFVERLLQEDESVSWSLLSLYDSQEYDEQARHITIHRNGIGFNAADARIFSPMAQQILRGEELSAEQLSLCRQPIEHGLPRLGRYRRQLVALLGDSESDAPMAETRGKHAETGERLVIG